MAARGKLDELLETSPEMTRLWHGDLGDNERSPNNQGGERK